MSHNVVVTRGMPLPVRGADYPSKLIGLDTILRYERLMFNTARSILGGQARRWLSAVAEYIRGGEEDANIINEAMPKLEEWQEPTEPLFRKIFSLGHRTALDIIGAGAMSDVERQILFDFLVANEFEYVKGINDLTKQKFRNAFIAWMRDDGGQDIKLLAKRLKPYVGPVRAEMIATTEVNRAFNDAVLETWRAEGSVKFIRFMTASDERVCPICAPLHGVTTDISFAKFAHPVTGKFFPIPPLHPRCRCRIIPTSKR